MLCWVVAAAVEARQLRLTRRRRRQPYSKNSVQSQDYRQFRANKVVAGHAADVSKVVSRVVYRPCWPGGVSLALRKRRVSDLMARDGVVAQDQKDLLKLNHQPVRSIKGASRYFS